MTVNCNRMVTTAVILSSFKLIKPLGTGKYFLNFASSSASLNSSLMRNKKKEVSVIKIPGKKTLQSISNTLWCIIWEKVYAARLNNRIKTP